MPNNFGRKVGCVIVVVLGVGGSSIKVDGGGGGGGSSVVWCGGVISGSEVR